MVESAAQIMAKKGPGKKPPLKPRRPKRTPPICKAFLIADRVIRDETTRAITLVGLFTEFPVRQFPAYVPPFFLFAQFCDGLTGTYAIEVEIQDLASNTVIATLSGVHVEFSYRPQTVDVIFRVPPLPILNPAYVFAVVLFADGHPITEQKFTLKQIGTEDEPS